jgi:SMC interacting uncharacterized protein involved in chromosome segregation
MSDDTNNNSEPVDSGSTSETETLTLEQLQAENTKLRDQKRELSSQRDELRNKVKEFTTKEEEFAKKSLEEQGKFKELYELAIADKSKLETSLKHTTAKSVLGKALVDAKTTALDTALALVSLDSLQYDANNNPISESIAEVVANLTKQHPVLFGKAIEPVAPARPGEKPPLAGYETELKALIAKGTKGTKAEFSALKTKYGRI